MKKIFIFIVAMFFTACSGENKVPIEVSVSERHNPILHRYVKYLSITSLVDSVKITNIIPNRGKCKVGGLLDKDKAKIDKILSYGETWDYIPLVGCDKVLEVQVETDHGDWTFSFN
ncbi:hypothetical protein [Campylobacter insulaenigrae]|uniref:hypothetical protein n=1 Tax=Campylobacter insulaenigrae TaxID=260714 RepID=UPI000F6E2F2C|nr:hypothetical protein [Campylobacter insulaenigrae]MCR6591697.1 hypothetical protein [Campylobacter insulaenigrae]MCR6593223.1 hypothetical protein [Campylobacter insulaenigrae]MCR6594485.1 hypothetical protein [Campylobacter insulaenigrae]VEJ52530.1 Uncharacterised protein [Campylobacter insulaenigrae]